MCGIAGFLGTGDHVDIERMTRALAHRGPDDEQFYTDPINRLFFGFRRLSVLDHAGGRQPMQTADGNLTLIFNGEIYNHRELRHELEVRGHRFTSDHADTEVILHGYREWRDELPLRLNGMFAFAVYDCAKGTVFLARDRFGEKPLFIYRTPGLFAFASELSAITTHTAIDRTWNATALQKYFAYGYFPASSTPFTGVEKLPAGHRLVVRLADGAVSRSAYWSFHLQPDSQLSNEKQLAEELRDHLSTAVARRLQADVPLGILLSGGIDSSAIVALAAENQDAADLSTFSIAFDEPSYDESAHARCVAQHIGTRHRVQRCSLDQMRDQIPSLLARIDEPLGDSSLLPTHQVCAFARKHVTVALSGDGGDELFAGYDPFRALGLSHVYQRLVPGGLHRWIAALIGRLPMSDSNMSLDFKLRRTLRGLNHRPALWNPIWMAPLAPNEIAELFAMPTDPEELYAEAITAWNACDSENTIDRTSEFFTRLYLQDDILTKSDRASMTESLELRAPFLDNDLVDFATRLPAHMKYRHGRTKHILRRAVARDLPSDIITRPKKGFGIPLSSWLRDLPAPQGGQSELPLDENWLATRWAEHRERRADWRHALWCWMTLRAN